MITVQVYLFSTIRARIGQKKLEFELPPGSKVEDLKQVLTDQYPQAASTVKFMLTSVNQVFSDDKTLLSDNADVAFFPHVSGG